MSSIAWSPVRPSSRTRPFLYRNLGDGTFADIAVAAGLKRSFGSMGAGLGDVDNDGFVDIYLANGGPQMARLEPNALFRNLGDGTFADITATAGTGSLGKGHGATFADFDQDGDLDLYAGLGGHYDADTWDNALYRNDGPAQHYLSIELVGTQTNRSGLGARVAAFAAGRAIRAQRQSGFGFGSSNEPLLHLGLGSATRVDSLHVLWPGQPPQRFLTCPSIAAFASHNARRTTRFSGGHHETLSVSRHLLGTAGRSRRPKGPPRHQPLRSSQQGRALAQLAAPNPRREGVARRHSPAALFPRALQFARRFRDLYPPHSRAASPPQSDCHPQHR